jgi:hypothetical protein
MPAETSDLPRAHGVELKILQLGVHLLDKTGLSVDSSQEKTRAKY